jgi:hypothetical protein
MRYAFITVLLLFAIANPTSVHACTCFCKKHGVNDPKEMERESKAVFVGEVIAMHDATPEELRHGSDKFEWEMRVERYWKGVKTQQIFISANGVAMHGCCDIALDMGNKYLVYVVGKEMRTSCTRTKLLVQATDDLKALGPGKTFSK